MWKGGVEGTEGRREGTTRGKGRTGGGTRCVEGRQVLKGVNAMEKSPGRLTLSQSVSNMHICGEVSTTCATPWDSQHPLLPFNAPQLLSALNGGTEP